jgi:xylitol oxidase
MFMRTIKADDFWMSENSGGDAHVSIHFTFQPNMPAVLEVLPQIEQALLPFGARPHWGKFFTMKPADFLPSYPNLEAWK